MRKLLFVVFLFIACSRETPETAAPPAAPAAPETVSAPAPAPAAPVAPATPTPASGAVERGAFVVLRDGQPLYREEFARSATRIESDIAASGQNDRVQQVTELNPDATVKSTAVKAVGSKGTQAMMIVMRGNRADAEVVDRQGVAARKSVEVPPNTIPNPVPESLAMLEQVIRRAKAIGGPKAEIPLLPGTLQPQRVFVTFTGADTAKVETASSTIEVKIDAEGRVLSATEPIQKLTIRRE